MSNEETKAAARSKAAELVAQRVALRNARDQASRAPAATEPGATGLPMARPDEAGAEAQAGQEHAKAHTSVHKDAQAQVGAVMLIPVGKLDRKTTARPAQWVPTTANWERFKAMVTNGSEQVALNAIIAAGLDALEARAKAAGGVLKIGGE